MSRLRHDHVPLILVTAAMTAAAVGCSSGGVTPEASRAPATAASPAPTTTSAAPAAIPTAKPARVLRDVAYATRSKAQRLDLYLPTGAGPHPVVVFVHGGAWLTGDKAGPIAQAVVPVLLARGYAVASINYRLSGEARFPAQVQDTKAALRWLRANARSYALDPARFAGFGESAGAHTLALVAVTQGTTALEDPASRGTAPGTLKSVLLWYPPVDLLASHDWLTSNAACAGKIDDPDGAKSPESRLLGAPVQTVPDRARAANPVTYLVAGRPLPPMLIQHGDRDCTAPLQGSQELYDAVVKVAGRDAAQLTVLKGSGHYLDFDAAAAAPAALTFLDRTIGTAAR